MLDLGAAPWLKDAVLGAMASSACRAIELDAGAVTQIDTANVQILLAARRDLQRTGGDLRVLSASPALLRVTDQLGLTGALDLAGGRREAVATESPGTRARE